jgi:hypothetical protein
MWWQEWSLRVGSESFSVGGPHDLLFRLMRRYEAAAFSRAVRGILEAATPTARS